MTKIARDSYEEQMSKVQLVENETIQSLEEEFATLLAHERDVHEGCKGDKSTTSERGGGETGENEEGDAREER